MYLERVIDGYLRDWRKSTTRKPLLLRGARQVGKSTAVRHLSAQFDNYVEINFEKMPSYKVLFEGDINVRDIITQMSAMYGQQIAPGRTLLFLDEVQDCIPAIMSLRYFKEDLPDLHVIAAGSLLEFALDDIPTYGVAGIHSMFMFPMTFDEFLLANGESLLLSARRHSSASNPLPDGLYKKLVNMFRIYLLVGGMPESVASWVKNKDFIKCQEIQDDIILGYDADFAKYRRKINPEAIRQTLKSVARQVGSNRFKTNDVPGYKSKEVFTALDALVKAGIIVPVTHTAGNGLPLCGETDGNCRKYLLLDTGLLLRMQDMSMNNMTQNATFILTSTVTDLVNKGPLAEMLAGLEFMRYLEPNIRHDLYYWLRHAKNAIAEVDYLTSLGNNVLPIEVKADTQGGMKSLWSFMRDKKLQCAVRCSLENFGFFKYVDKFRDDQGNHVEITRDVAICPLFAMAQLQQIGMSIMVGDTSDES